MLVNKIVHRTTVYTNCCQNPDGLCFRAIKLNSGRFIDCILGNIHSAFHKKIDLSIILCTVKFSPKVMRLKKTEDRNVWL